MRWPCRTFPARTPVSGRPCPEVARCGPSENLQSSDAAPASSAPDVIERVALLVAGDGSALRVEEFAELPTSGADQPLPASGTLSGAQLSELASSAARAWVGGAASPIAVPARSPCGKCPVEHGGDALTGRARHHDTFVQRPGADRHVQCRRSTPSWSAAAGGKAALTQGLSRLWDSAPVTSTTAFLGTQVQGRSSAPTDRLPPGGRTDTAADARDRYGDGACWRAVSRHDARARCDRTRHL